MAYESLVTDRTWHAMKLLPPATRSFARGARTPRSKHFPSDSADAAGATTQPNSNEATPTVAHASGYSGETSCGDEAQRRSGHHVRVCRKRPLGLRGHTGFARGL